MQLESRSAMPSKYGASSIVNSTYACHVHAFHVMIHKRNSETETLNNRLPDPVMRSILRDETWRFRFLLKGIQGNKVQGKFLVVIDRNPDG